jgi:mannitol-1-phosphate/altronate dehydrogenase
MKKFIMYGAGNIGRGFIGQLFSLGGYKVGFIDINKEVISRLNSDQEYCVEVVSSSGSEEIIVKNVYGIDGSDIDLVAEEIASADIMATAIGVNVLKFIAKQKSRNNKSNNSTMVAHSTNTDKFAIYKRIKYLPRLSKIIKSIWIIDEYIS